MGVDLLDIRRVEDPLRAELDAAISDVIDSARYIKGPPVQRFEQEVARLFGVAHAVGCASGSDALALALLALGVGPGDDVITTPFSFFATAGSIARVGARPVFVDIEHDTYNIDAALLESALSPRTRAIMPVHLFGQCANMQGITAIASARGIPVIEDGAQSVGAKQCGKYASTIGDIGTLSFFPSKNLGCWGDGGMVLTDDEALACKARKLGTHGGSSEYFYEMVGLNSRLDTIQAAVLSVKLPHLDSWNRCRRQNAEFYQRRLAGLPFRLPVIRPENESNYNQYVVRTPKRDALLAHLKKNGVGCKVYYPKCLHLQQCFVNLGYQAGDFPVAEQASSEVLAIPIFNGLTDSELEEVSVVVEGFFYS